MNYFAGQGNVKISLDTGMDISTATNFRIWFTRPNGSKGYWSAARVGQAIEYSTQNTDIDQPGTWSFQAFCSMSGQNMIGDIVKQEFLQPLNTP